MEGSLKAKTLNSSRNILNTLLLVAGLLLLPQLLLAETKYMGAATCASSNCHGGVKPKSSSVVLQNEYTTWFRHDAHARAYEVLREEDSKIIAKHLGLGSPENEPLCLSCHATFVPSQVKGPKFRLSDGVSCESCHGAAENYLKTHTTKGRTNKDNIKDGMKDLASLDVRSKVCLDCHAGNDDKNVNHRLIGAGHPRLTFELDTFSMLQPNHWQVDNDYTERKGEYVPMRSWLLGQAYRSQRMLEALQSKKRAKVGVLPELSLFYCYSCHHSLEEEQWKSRSYNGAPGELHLNISSLIVLREALMVIDENLSSKLGTNLKLLHKSYTQGAEEQVVSNISVLLSASIIPRLEAIKENKATAKKLLKQIVNYSVSEKFLPYEIAEQCAMAMSVLLTTVDPTLKLYEEGISAVYESLEKEKSFKPEQFSKASQALHEMLKSNNAY